jgi:hypothetical protein
VLLAPSATIRIGAALVADGAAALAKIAIARPMMRRLELGHIQFLLKNRF